MPVLTDQTLELKLKKCLESNESLSELAPVLLQALTSNSKSRKLTAQRFLQLHPDWSTWKKTFEPWLRSESQWPWIILLSWLHHQKLVINLKDKELLYEKIQQQNQLSILAKASGWQVLYETLDELKLQARHDLHNRIMQMRALLFEELHTWKSQRLREQELKVLARLKKKFPQDQDIENEQKVFKEAQALEKLHARLREQRKFDHKLELPDDNIKIPDALKASLQAEGEYKPELFYDLAIFCCFLEDWKSALGFINQVTTPSQARDWLEIEILIHLHRYVDVLQGLSILENRWHFDAETFFASSYARAQAYYGLNQKEKALEVLETLLSTRPLYRQASELLSLWKSP